jgi:photosystem II stability/assembly factor-like uncharacterized protein
MKLISKIIILIFVLALFQTADARWVKRDSNTLAWLKTVHFIDANTGFIGGSSGTLLKTFDGGKSWKESPKFTKDTILEIVFTDQRTGWILCERDIFSLGDLPPSYLMKTTDGGTSWKKIDFGDSDRKRISRIFFSKNGFGLAVGETGTLYGLQDDNRTWKRLSPPSLYLMCDGFFTDDLQGTIVGGGGTIFFTEDAGTTWNPAFVSDKQKAKLNSVFFIDKNHGWTVGSNGKIYQTINGGKFWRTQRSSVSENLNDIYFLNNAEGWAIGNGGTILHTTTAGNVWKEERTSLEHKLEKIAFHGKKGWIVGFGGTIMSYDPSDNSTLKRPEFGNR